MSARRIPVSRRDRPAKPPLSREGVVATALQIMREEGLERVTMRRLATELDTGPASLYVYLRNTAELHGALLDELLADLPAPAEDRGAAWSEQLTELLIAYTTLLFGYPSLARSVLTLRPYGPRYLALIESILGLLAAGGVQTRQAAWGVDLLLQHATATAAEQGSRTEAGEAEHEQEELVAAISAAATEDYPHIVRARDELFSGTGLERMRWAFGQILKAIAD
ncbi:TetR/AcrR family transcriptional regulator C-terminal domain-containing protein [Paractinoplanes ferrugineus]|uniref:TetR family transcriptional regulator n=1 Tax=Paractinoplanes ferrugineus TaxID=113564 RepID=A0A919MEQ9_9ACTN|nr:TetR/AcrR family transcriptional regulator C-terminal domain-containing protein [Actinoplanes ferrugineus]GIE11959.1 TetR family transcriptional regulator [Actinoplanes ferrugineus]